jgi:hypothetical protein
VDAPQDFFLDGLPVSKGGRGHMASFKASIVRL